MSWISEVPWEEPTKVASLAIGHVKEWYSSHPFGQYVLVILAVFWIGHIVSQLVSKSRQKGLTSRCLKIQLNHRLFSIYFPGWEVWSFMAWNHTNSLSVLVRR